MGLSLMRRLSGIAEWPAERRFVRMLLLAYGAFILYGTFIPFRFSADPNLLHHQLSRAQILPYQAGVKNFSIPDVVSNILLFVPFGTLVVGAGVRIRGAHFPWARVVLVGGYGLGFGLAIEAGQVFTPYRTTSLLDTTCNAIGAVIGAILGYCLLRSLGSRRKLSIPHLLRERPTVLLLGVVVLAAMADAFYPFEPTLDVSTVLGNLKRGRWFPFQDGPYRALGDMLVDKILLFAVLGDVARRSLADRDGALSVLRQVWLPTVLFAASLEGGKLFFMGRAPNVESLLLASLGALLGILVVPLLAATTMVTKHPIEILFGLALLLIVYAELTPFTWAVSADAVAAKASRVEWLPMASYYRAEPRRALFDLGKKVFLVCPLGVLAAARRTAVTSPGRRWMAATWGFGVGIILETFQLLQVSRLPSTTDVLVFGASAWIGAVLFERYRAIVNGA
jgi:VanZ family protein